MGDSQFASPPGFPPPPRTLLLVADDEPARTIYAELFRMRGYAVIEVADVEAALELLGKREHVDTVLIALGDGAKAAGERIRLERPGLQVHFATADQVGEIELALGRVH